MNACIASVLSAIFRDIDAVKTPDRKAGRRFPSGWRANLREDIM